MALEPMLIMQGPTVFKKLHLKIQRCVRSISDSCVHDDSCALCPKKLLFWLAIISTYIDRFG